ncbi:ATP-binding protein [Gluconobacter kondonii]|uniref:ATP-binding protein n=1 Tax=Gluconobacter kondonii TaxID=941463 RepID=UPI00197D6878|nr:ATP-binding protein [Gluconobacter kondonii]MBN3868027.1 ATP-binding protein [Gluconobacter kondonii]
MTLLSSKVAIDRRFARSARLDADLNGTPPLVGYVLQATVAKALTILAESQIESHQGAFTWTGPYGGGKSSAALLLANLIAGTRENRKIARELAGTALTELYSRAFPKSADAWKVVAVTGRRVRLREAIADAAANTFNWDQATRKDFEVSDETLINALLPAGNVAGGTLLILDELGKMLEHEALEGGDVHLLQDIAEHASRSDGRLVVIGILHQSFEQYAARAARDARQEWAKIQGRYQDIAFLSGADETVALLGRAINSKPPASAETEAAEVAEAIAKRRPTEVSTLTKALAKTWPLNPVTALLLGPVSRARFAQNERSVFGFLSSAEPAGFQQFLSTTEIGATTYDPSMLWDYLSANFGMSLASGPDGSRFSLAFEAIERAGAKGGPQHVALTKAAAIIEFFRNGSGLSLADDIIAVALPNIPDSIRIEAIKDLLDWAVLIRQPRLGGYALFAGSDFDLEDAIGRAIAPVGNAQLEDIPQRVGFGFATAKRHYFLTGALRTFEIALQIVGADDTAEHLAASLLNRPKRGSGLLALTLSDGTLQAADVDVLAKATAKKLKGEGRIVAIGAASNSFALRSTAAELLAVERVIRDHPQLEGDRIARREISARQSLCIDQLHQTLEAALETARWFLAPSPKRGVRQPLAIVASALADAGYPSAPILKSELLQRDKPSSNAMAALRGLAHAMVNSFEQADLGITGYPAELGLYLTTLKPFGLHHEVASGIFAFGEPDESEEGQSLQPAWAVLDEFGADGLEAVFQQWTLPPFGLKAGVMPVLALAYMLARRDSVAVYIDGTYQTVIDDVVVDKLLQKPSDFRLRRIDRSIRETAFLSGLAQRLATEASEGSLPVAAALFQRFEALPAFAKRTQRVDADARAVRGVVVKAEDPEALLFDAFPEVFGERLTPSLVYEGLLACETAYPVLLVELRQALARALGVEVESFSGISERVASVRGLTNDYAFDALADRAAAIEQGTGDLESLVSVLLHRPSRNWSDRDREEALTEIARFGRRFRELEALAVVRNRQSHTEALALVVGLDPKMPPLLRSFVLNDKEKKVAARLADRVIAELRADDKTGRLRLAALARAVAMLAAETDDEVEAV